MAKKALGTEEYKPTRLEWLAVLANSIIPRVNNKGFHIYCLAGEDEKSIIVNIQHDRNADKEHISQVETSAKEFVLGVAEMYEWDSWVNVETVTKAK